MALTIGSRLGSYQILGPLGAGGMGEVYRARDTRLGRDVAIKLLPADLASDPGRLARLEREARTVASLNHPGIVTLHSIEDEGGIRFLTMELVEGQSLDRQLTPGGLPVARVLDMAIPLADALSAAHRKGIVHRDLKPANVMLTSDGRLKVLDFGLAKAVSLDAKSYGAGTLDASQAETAAASLTRAGSVMGTAPYMAPEQIRGEAVDARTDLFALGIVLYELASGRRPFAGPTFADLASAILRDAPAPLSAARADVPVEFERVVMRCLEKDPDDRFTSAHDVLHDLRALRRALESGVPAAPNAPQVAPATAKARPARAPIAAMAAVAAIIAIAALAGGYFVWRNGAPGHSGSATTGKRSVAVLDFENVSGDPSLDWMKRGVAELLSSALVQSPALDVFDGQRLGDLAGAERAASPPAPGYAFLARHGIRRAIVGNILRSGRDMRIEGRIVDTDGGRPVHSYAVESSADSGLFSVVGLLVANLQVALEVNLTGDREAEGWLREITTTSTDAYRLYLKGHEAQLASRWHEAAAAFEQALAIDSTFIAARSELSGAYWNLGDHAKLGLTRAAMSRLRGRADHRGQLKIDLLESVVGKDPPGLIRAASELSELYPEDRFYTYLLGRGYYTAGQYQRCLDTLRPLVEQRYSWAYTYALTARSAAHLGDSTAARRVFDLGIEVTHADADLVYAYAGFLRARGDHRRIRTVIDQALGSPALAENPVAEGELRMELAKELSLSGDVARARKEMKRATGLIPRDDEARADADSMARWLGLN